MKTIIYFCLLFMACEVRHNCAINDAEILGKWKLDSIIYKQNEEIDRFSDTSDKVILIELSDSSLAKLTGYCNNGSAKYSLYDDSIEFLDVTLTERACPFAGGIWETYLYELNNVTSFRLEGSKLILFTKSAFDLYFSRIND